MDINQLITSIEVELDLAEKKRNQALEKIKYTLANVGKEGRSGFTKEEREEVERLQEVVAQAEPELREIQAKLDAANRAKEQELKLEKLNAERTQTSVAEGKPSYDRVARVGREERTYNPEKDRRGKQFLTDVVRQFLFRDLEAEQRLIQHMREERVERAEYMERAVGTGAFAGLVVPQYLTELYAPRVQALRPFADICNKHDLPASGMTVNISRITTGTGVGLQATENSSVTNVDIDDTLLTETVQTAAGQQTISRQAIERGTGIEDVVLDDLFRAYATTLDTTLINQATTGLSAVSTAVAYTDASPTAAELWPKLHQAAAGIEAAMLGNAVPSHVIMHSRRWYWLQSQVGSSWPFMSQPGIGTQAGGVNLGTNYGDGARGVLPNGMLAIVDNNIATNLGAGTNEDEVYVVANDECHLWEDDRAPVFLRAEQPAAASLGVLLVIYGYFAYSFRRYTNAMQKIGGTGLISPTF
jgi:HK97 family phage major capsid protein